MKRRACLAGLSVLAAGGLLPLAPACGPSEIPDKRRALLTSWGHAFLLPAYAEFEAHCVELEVQIALLRDAPSEEALLAAREVWLAAREPWKQAEVFAFGPFTEEPLRYGPKIDFWPARPETVEETLSGSDPIEADLLGAPAKGLHAIEYLLYQPDSDVLAGFADDPRRGEYAAIIAQDLILRARELWEAWHPDHGNFLAELVEAGRASTRFDTLDKALGEIVNRMGYTLENMRLEKLAKPAGDTAGGVPQPELSESPFSGRSLRDLADNLRGIERLYFGDPARELLGLDEYLRYRGRDLTGTVRARVDACRAALEAVPEPLGEAVSTAPAAVRALMDRLSELQRTIQVDVINGLSLTVGFNDNDGD